MKRNGNEKKYSEKKQKAKELNKQSFNSLIVLGKQTLGFRAAKKKGFRLSVELSKVYPLRIWANQEQEEASTRSQLYASTHSICVLKKACPLIFQISYKLSHTMFRIKLKQ